MKKIGIIGCGWVSEFYGKCVERMASRCRIAWVAEPDAEKAANFTAKFGGEILPEYRGELADGIVVATPHFLHHRNCLDAMGKCAVMLVEKPLGLSVAECDEIIAARDKSETRLLLGYVNRFRKGPLAMKAQIEAGRIGEPLTFDISQLGFQESYIGGWILKRETLGGGCFFSSAGHLIDLSAWMLGPIERLQVELARRRLHRMEGEDTALALARFKSGLIGTIRESWCAKSPKAWQAMTVYGSEGTLEWTYQPREAVPQWQTCLWDGTLVLRMEGKADEVIHQDAALFDFDGQMTHFLDCLEGRAEPSCTAEDGREVIRLVRAAEALAKL